MGDVPRGWTWKSKCLKELKCFLHEALQEVEFNDAFDKAFRLIWVSEEDKMHAFDFVKLHC